MRILVLLVSLLFAGPTLAQTADDVSGAINSIFGDAREFERAFVVIQAAAVEGDAATVASYVAYPITTNTGGNEITAENEQQFIDHYDTIMTEDVHHAIVSQAYENLFVNADGVMFGDGELWLNGICQDDACTGFDVRIITIQSTGE